MRKFFDSAEVLPHKFQFEGEINFDFPKKYIVVMISCDLGVLVFFAEIPNPQKNHARMFLDFLQVWFTVEIQGIVWDSYISNLMVC